MQPNTMTIEAFALAIDGMDWSSTDQFVDRLDEVDFWSEEFYENAYREHKNAYVRSMIGRLTDDHGNRLWASVEQVDAESGENQRFYKQEKLFDRDDYIQVINYHRRRAMHHLEVAAGYAQRAKTRLNMQVPEIQQPLGGPFLGIPPAAILLADEPDF